MTALDVCLIDGSMRSPEGHATWKFLPTKIERLTFNFVEFGIFVIFHAMTTKGQFSIQNKTRFLFKVHSC